MNVESRRDFIEGEEYVESLLSKKNFKWKLRLRLIDYFHIFLLALFLKVTWFKKYVYIYFPYRYGPPLHVLVQKLIKRGILSEVIPIRSVEGMYAYNCHLLQDGKILLKSTGCDRDPNNALSKALGEYMERWMRIFGDVTQGGCRGSYTYMSSTRKYVYHPETYHRHVPVQKKKFKELGIADDVTIEWLEGYHFSDNKPVLIPKNLIFKSKTTQHVSIQSTTNGCAGFFTEDEAVSRAILEYVERDAFFVHWLNSIKPKIINQETLPEDLRKTLKELVALDVEVFILDITTDMAIPSVCIVLMTTKYDGKITVAAAAELTYYEACKKAFNEAFANTDFFSRQGAPLDIHNYVPFVNSVNKEERTHLWQGQDWLEAFKWFISGETISFPTESVMYPDSTSKIEELKKKFGKLEYKFTPYIYVHRHPLLEETGYHVAQAFIPFAFPLYLDEKYGTFDSDRLSSFARKNGIKEIRVNPFPHPFP